MTTAAKVSAQCPSCGKKAKRVSPVTLHALLRSEFAHQVTTDEQWHGEDCRPINEDTGWRFCNSPDCDTVYFSERGDATFTRSQLKVSVGVKETNGERPLCYCFGHSVASIKEELRTKSRSEALEDIRAKMKDPGCHCETSNPSGSCCLGSVTKGVQIAKEELGMNDSNMTPLKPAGSSTGRGETIAKIGTVVSAIMASACCWLPLVLLAVGVSGAGIAATLETYRPLFIVVTFGFLAAAFYFTYRPKKAAAAAGHGCCATEPAEGVDCCAPTGKRRFTMMTLNKAILWAVTVLAFAFLLFPHYVGALLGTSGAQTAVVTPDMNRAVLQIEGMTCQGCEAVAEKAIRTVPGVLAVEVSYEKRQAVVGVDRARDIPRDEILAALEKASYQGRFVEAPPGSDNTGREESSLSTVTLSISGMTCPACAVSAQSALTKLAGVQSAHVDATTGKALVQFDADRVRPEDLAKAVTNVGFESSVKNEEN